MTTQTCVIPGCGKRDPDTGERQPRVAAYGMTCDRCFERYCEWLPEIIEMYAIAPEFVDPDTRLKEEVGRSGGLSPVSPEGARLDVIGGLDSRTMWSADDSWDWLGVLEEWTRMIREERGMSAGGPASITTEVNFLSAHAQWCAAQPWVDEMYGEVRQVWQQLRMATGRGPDPILGYCGRDTPDGECGGAIRQIPGQLTLMCGRCREVWETPEERARGTMMMRVS